MSQKYIFTMIRLSKVHPPDKEVLKDITLAFLPGAKIGVLGPNGSGKSTLLRIMAGLETEFRGDAQLAPGATVGLLEQEPTLNEDKDVRGNVEEGVAEVKALLDRFNELSASYSDETAEEMAKPCLSPCRVETTACASWVAATSRESTVRRVETSTSRRVLLLPSATKMRSSPPSTASESPTGSSPARAGSAGSTMPEVP